MGKKCICIEKKTALGKLQYNHFILSSVERQLSLLNGFEKMTFFTYFYNLLKDQYALNTN